MKKMIFVFAVMLLVSSAVHAQNLKDSATYKDIFGKYNFEPGNPIDEAEIVWRDSSVVISTSMGDAVLDQLGADSFHMSYQDGTILFKRGDDKKVNQILIMVSGTTLDGKKAVAAKGTALRKEEIEERRLAVAKN